MRHNHFSMLPEQAFKPRCGRFGGMTLEGGGGGRGGGGEAPPPPQRATNPRPVAPYTSAGGGFMGRTPYGSPGTSASFPQSRFNADYYLAQNPDVARDRYYGSNPFEHYQDFGFYERRTPSENFQYAPSQQRLFNPTYAGTAWNPEMLNLAYQKILGRAPDTTALQFWPEAFNKGLTGQGFISSLTTSPEFQRTQEYQRAYTEAFRPGYQEFGPSGQYYQPIYQSSYANYPSAARPYQPTYSTRMMSPSQMGYGFGSFNPFSYAEGGDVEEDEGIAALRNA